MVDHDHDHDDHDHDHGQSHAEKNISIFRYDYAFHVAASAVAPPRLGGVALLAPPHVDSVASTVFSIEAMGASSAASSMVVGCVGGVRYLATQGSEHHRRAWWRGEHRHRRRARACERVARMRGVGYTSAASGAWCARRRAIGRGGAWRAWTAWRGVGATSLAGAAERWRARSMVTLVAWSWSWSWPRETKDEQVDEG